MAVDSKLFDAAAKALGLSRWPTEGEVIFARRRTESAWTPVTVVAVWYGMEVMVEVAQTPRVITPALCPGLGDRLAYERRVSVSGFDASASSGTGRWEKVQWADAVSGEVVAEMVRAVCDEVTCPAGVHTCGRLDVGIVRDDPERNPDL